MLWWGADARNDMNQNSDDKLKSTIIQRNQRRGFEELRTLSTVDHVSPAPYACICISLYLFGRARAATQAQISTRFGMSFNDHNLQLGRFYKLPYLTSQN